MIYDDLAAPTTAMEEASELSQQLMVAEQKMLQAEQAYKEAKAAYEHLAMETIPEFYKANGISKLCLDDGTTLSVEQKVTCSPRKDQKFLLVKWLKEHGGADLVKEKLSVSPAFTELLKSTNVPFVAEGDVNTNSLKSWLAEQLGIKHGSVAKMNYDDLPDYLNFYKYNTTVVTHK